MKAFNLEEALAGKPVITRMNVKVTDIHYFESAVYDSHRLRYVVNGYLCVAKANGRYDNDSNDSPFDLFMASEKKEGWINIYSNQIEWGLICYIYTTEERANKNAADNRIACIKIEWEE